MIQGTEPGRCPSVVRATVRSLGLLLLGLGCLCEGESRDIEGLGTAPLKVMAAGHEGFLLKPDPHWPGKNATPWVFYAPTLPPYPGKEEHWMIRRFLAAGVAVAGIDVGESYGNFEGRLVYTAFFNRLVKEHGLAPKACLLARSRGGLMLYNWAVENPEKVASISGIYPVCDLRTYPGVEKASAAYGLSVNEMDRLLPLNNPVDRLGSLAKAHVPIFHIHGDKDRVVPFIENAAVVSDRYESHGGAMELVTAKGQWHNMWEGFFQCEELVAFTLKHARAVGNTNSDSVSRIVLGSCAREAKPQPFWRAIARRKPDLFLFIGDNIYADTDDPKVFRDKYQQLADKPGFDALRSSVPLLATWDDHDYGVNDGGKEFKAKAAAKSAFLDFFGGAFDAPVRSREGIYQARTFGPKDRRVQVILLDTRTFRDALEKRNEEERKGGFGPYKATEDGNTTLLGEKQWAWLKAELEEPAKIRIVASSIQVVSGEHGYECWGNFPHERSKLFKLIKETGANGVVFVSGDRHLAELSCDREFSERPYPMFDLTSSGLNQSEGGRYDEPNRHRSSGIIRQQNFGMIAIDWEAQDPTVEFRIYVTKDIENDVEEFLKFNFRTRLSELTLPK